MKKSPKRLQSAGCDFSEREATMNRGWSRRGGASVSLASAGSAKILYFCGLTELLSPYIKINN